VLRVVLASDDPDLVERLRNAVAPFGWRAAVETGGGVPPDQTERQYRTIRTGLLLGALVTLLLAGASLLALAVEQVMERRRQVAVLSASGVPRSVLARSVLWQNALPMALAVPVAVLTGVALSRLLLRLIGRSPAVDWAGIGVLVMASAALVLAATALTLPALRRASQPTELRAE
jgi:predicted lysophospholipase L1 biosynthesis ABC-type transport system permease subunit